MFKIVEEFEKRIAEFYQAPYAVAVDCCTHAIELSLRYSNIKDATCPSNTYISIPFTLKKLGIHWSFEDNHWKDYYFLGNTNIVDAAVYWKQGGYINNTFMCLSFQFKKHLNLTRGGAILVSNYDDFISLKKLSYDGRLPEIPWMEQDISTLGYHYYMTPEIAEMGLNKLQEAIENPPRVWSYLDYPYLPNMTVFKNAS